MGTLPLIHINDIYGRVTRAVRLLDKYGAPQEGREKIACTCGCDEKQLHHTITYLGMKLRLCDFHWNQALDNSTSPFVWPQKVLCPNSPNT